MLQTECEETQNNEIQALQSIFDEDFRLEVAEHMLPWNKKPLQSFVIAVRLTSSDVSQSGPQNSLPAVMLRITYSTYYPKHAPTFELLQPSHLSKRNCQELSRALDSMIQRSLGAEMIFDMVDLLKTEMKHFIKAPQASSLIDERDARLEEVKAMHKAQISSQESQAAHTKAEEEAVLRSKIDQELQLKTRGIKSKSATGAATRSVPGAYAAEVITFSRDVTIQHISLKSMTIGYPIVYGDKSTTQPSLTFIPEVGQIVVKKFLVAATNKDNLKDIEMAVDRSLKANIPTDVSYGVQNYGACFNRIDESHWIFYVIQQHSPKGNLSDLLGVVGTVSIVQAKTWMIDLAQELSLAHRLGILHRHIVPSKVLLFETNGRTVPRLADWDYSYLIHRQDVYFEASRLPYDERFSIRSSGRRHDDVADLGVVFLQMVFGEKLHSANTVEQFLRDFNHTIDQDLLQFFNEFFGIDARRRVTASDLLSSEFLRSADLVPLSGLAPASDSALSSRYRSDFLELEKIGSGGYGTVFKAKNRLDSRVYAIKKQDLHNPTMTENRVLREVSGLARLNHVAVVRYFSSWVEEAGQTRTKLGSDSSSATSDLDELFMVDDFMSTSGIIFASTGVNDESSNLQHSLSAEDVKASLISTKEVVPRTLFIQMEYCSGNTLRTLIDNHLIGQLYWNYFAQIVDGVSYIHGQGLAHRDLKPANIFVSKDLQLKIGDFGLAGEITVDAATTYGTSALDENTGALGTYLYQAPELDPGKSMASYDAKVDLYALGIILAELCSEWSTGMERINALRALRTPEIVCSLDTRRQDKEVSIIKALLSHKPAERPTAEQLSKLLPPIADKEYVKDFLKLLNDDPPFRKDVLEKLFSRDTALSEYTYDAGATTFESRRAAVSLELSQTMINVFRRHGAVDRSGSFIGVLPYNQHYMYTTNVLKFLDQNANVLQLPYDFKLPFARLLARKNFNEFLGHSFMLAPVYRSLDHRNSPVPLIEADFDVVTKAGELHDSGIETLRVAFEVIKEALPMTPEVCLHLGHHRLTHAILEYIGAVEETQKRKRVTTMLNQLSMRNTSISSWRRSLSSLLSQTSIESVLQFLPEASLDFEASLESFSALFSPAAKSEISQAIRQVTEIHRLMKLYRIDCPVIFQPFPPAYQTYDLTYSFVHNNSELLCVGGNYESLIQRMRLPGTEQIDATAAGFSFALDKVATLVLSELSPEHYPRHIDIVVSSYVHELKAVELITRLWDVNLSAELSNEENLLAYSQRRRALFAVSFRDKRLGNAQHQTLRVRNILKDETEDVSIDSIISYLQGELQEIIKKPVRENLLAVPRLTRGLSSRNEPDVLYVSTDEYRRMKLPQRSRIASKAIEAVQALTSELNEADIPTLIVDFESDWFQYLKAFDLHVNNHDEHSKRLVEKFPAVTRAHFLQMRQQITKLQDDGLKRVFLYSFRCQGLMLADI